MLKLKKFNEDARADKKFYYIDPWAAGHVEAIGGKMDENKKASTTERTQVYLRGYGRPFGLEVEGTVESIVAAIENARAKEKAVVSVPGIQTDGTQTREEFLASIEPDEAE